MTDNNLESALEAELFYTDSSGARVFKYADPRLTEDTDEFLGAMIPALATWIRDHGGIKL